MAEACVLPRNHISGPWVLVLLGLHFLLKQKALVRDGDRDKRETEKERVQGLRPKLYKQLTLVVPKYCQVCLWSGHWGAHLVPSNANLVNITSSGSCVELPAWLSENRWAGSPRSPKSIMGGPATSKKLYWCIIHICIRKMDWYACGSLPKIPGDPPRTTLLSSSSSSSCSINHTLFLSLTPVSPVNLWPAFCPYR